MQLRFSFLLLLVMVAFCRYGHAGLEWTNRDQELLVEAGKDAVIARFEFRNTGDYAVSIISTSSSCGCTSVSKEIFACHCYETTTLGGLSTHHFHPNFWRCQIAQLGFW